MSTAASKEDLWAMPLFSLVDETLPKSERAHGVDYAVMARAILEARIVIDATEATEKTARSAARSAMFTMIATFLLVVATLALLLD
jgi:hypothetical protein